MNLKTDSPSTQISTDLREVWQEVPVIFTDQDENSHGGSEGQKRLDNSLFESLSAAYNLRKMEEVLSLLRIIQQTEKYRIWAMSAEAEVSGQGVRVNGVAPGWIQSDMLDQALAGDEARKNKILSRTPMNGFGEPQDVGWATAFLCSKAAKFITGVILPVDGGASMGF